MKRFLKENPHVWWSIGVVLYIVFFISVEAWFPVEEYAVMYHPLDDKVPFCEWFVFPYLSWFVWLVTIGLILMFRDGGCFRRYIWYLLIGFTGAVIFGMCYPNGQDLRPALETLGRDNLLIRVIGFLYESDTNTLVCPSMHVIGSFGGTFAIFDFAKWKYPALARTVGIVGALLISASTVFVKQHSIVDVFWGLVVSAALCLFVYGFLKRKVTYFEKSKQK